MIIVMEFLKKTWVQICIAMLVALAAGYLVGRGLTPKPTIEVQERIVEKKVIDQVAIDVAVEAAKAEWSKNVKEKVIVRIVTKPSGEKTEETVRETETAETSKTETIKIVEKIVTKKEIIEKQVLIETKITPYTPKWSIGLQVHKELPGVLSSKVTDNVDYSALAGAKVVGSLWATSSYKIKSKELGIGLSYKF